MPFVPVDPIHGSNITYAVRRLARGTSPFLSILHIAFSGTYRHGSGGAPDAHYICGIVRTLEEVWNPSGIILDLTELNYQWGDEMGLVLEPPSDDPFVIIISPKCGPAISTLCYGVNSDKTVVDNSTFFNAFHSALDVVRQQVIDNWNALAVKHSLLPSTTGPLRTEDFQ